MSDFVRAIFIFLIQAIFNIYLFILVIRLILAWVSADYYLPLTQFIVKFTSFIIKPMKKFIPDFKGIEVSTLVLILVIATIKFLLLSFLSFGFPNLLGLILMAIADFLKLLFLTFFYAILLQAILSWIQPDSPMNRLLVQFNSPLLSPLQRVIPPVAGFDISPIPALILLQLLIYVLVYPLMAKGLGIAFG
jgi:YggT family protein